MPLVKCTEGVPFYDSCFDSENIPNPIPAGITLIRKNNISGILAQGVAGTLNLVDGTTVQITPKIGHLCFVKLLSFIQSGTKDSIRYDEVADYCYSRDNGGAHLVYDAFLRSLSQYFGEGLLGSRVVTSECGYAAKGQIAPIKTTLRILSRAQKPVFYKSKMRSTDSSLHRVVRFVAEWVYLKLDPAQKLKHSSVLGKVQHLFPPIKDLNKDTDSFRKLLLCPEEFAHRPYLLSTLRYISIILGEMGISSESYNNVAIQGSGFLVNTNKVFEDFCRKIISSALSESDCFVGGPDLSQKYLYDDFTFRLNPDIIVKNGDRVVIVADAKYKEVDQSDHYQMLSYMREFGVQTGYFICPAKTPGSAETISRSTSDGLRTCELKIDASDISNSILLIKQHLSVAGM
jgi:5-methylcytosine-specific restriction endonuclease McrBC regulatory subunit McrC